MRDPSPFSPQRTLRTKKPYLPARCGPKVLLLLGFFLSIALDASGETYLTQEQALRLVLPDRCQQPRHDPKPISAELHALLRANGVDRPEMSEAHFFVCDPSDSQPRRAALIDSEIGKHLPMTYIVGFTTTGAVSRVELMVFRETYGSQVRAPEFMQQFTDAHSPAALEIGQGIHHVTGATLSSRGITRGVRRALMLWRSFYG